MPRQLAVRESARTMFPKKPGAETRQRRDDANPKPHFAFRPPVRVQEYVLAAEEGGHSRTSVLVKMLETSMDAADELGLDWWELEKMAALEGVPVGRVLGRLAREQLQSAKPAKKR